MATELSPDSDSHKRRCLPAGECNAVLPMTSALVAAALAVLLSACASTSTESAYNAVGRGMAGLHEDGVLVAVEKYALNGCPTPAGCYARHYEQPDVELHDKDRKKFVEVTSGVKTMAVTHVVTYEGVERTNSAAVARAVFRAAPRTGPANLPDACRAMVSVDSPGLHRAGANRAPDGASHRVETHGLYNAYAAFEGYPYFQKRAFPFYACSHHALQRIGDWLHARLENAAQTGAPYSHVIVIAMGWNNDQQESLGRFNRMLKHVRAAATSSGGTYRPLVVALSWPSVWFSNADFRLTQLLGHILSYTNKTNDADEIGYTLGAELVHHIVGGAVESCAACNPQPTVAVIGHSLGARLLSRAVFSAAYVKPDRTRRKPRAPDYFLGLQGALSANRFVFGEGTEGSPYANLGSVKTRIVLTSAEADSANPVARFATGAKHVGGRFGLDAAKEHARVFCRAEVACKPSACQIIPSTDDGTPNQPTGPSCVAATAADGGARRVAMLDVKSILKKHSEEHAGDASLALGHADVPGSLKPKYVSAHNDILDDEMGRLIWALIGR